MAETVFITGTSTGIGRVTAVWFAERSWSVAATMRDPDRAGALGRSKPWAQGAAAREASSAYESPTGSSGTIGRRTRL